MSSNRDRQSANKRDGTHRSRGSSADAACVSSSQTRACQRGEAATSAITSRIDLSPLARPCSRLAFYALAASESSFPRADTTRVAGYPHERLGAAAGARVRLQAARAFARQRRSAPLPVTEGGATRLREARSFFSARCLRASAPPCESLSRSTPVQRRDDGADQLVDAHLTAGVGIERGAVAERMLPSAMLTPRTSSSMPTSPLSSQSPAQRGPPVPRRCGRRRCRATAPPGRRPRRSDRRGSAKVRSRGW